MVTAVAGCDKNVELPVITFQLPVEPSRYNQRSTEPEVDIDTALPEQTVSREMKTLVKLLPYVLLLKFTILTLVNVSIRQTPLFNTKVVYPLLKPGATNVFPSLIEVNCVELVKFFHGPLLSLYNHLTTEFPDPGLTLKVTDDPTQTESLAVMLNEVSTP